VSIFYFFNSFSLIFSFLLVIFSLYFSVALTHDAANSGPSGELGQGPDAAISGQGPDAAISGQSRCRTGSTRPGVRSGRREQARGRGRRAPGGAGEVGAVQVRSGRRGRGRGGAGVGEAARARATSG
jgi:hypothetical protein